MRFSDDSWYFNLQYKLVMYIAHRGVELLILIIFILILLILLIL